MAPPGTYLSSKHYILVALTATLIVAAVVTIVFVILSPARVDFAVTNPDSHVDDDGTVRLSLTLAASNPSGRAAVLYQSMLVDVSNSTGPHKVHWVIATVATPMPLLQPTRNVTTINASVSLVGESSAAAFTRNRSNEFSVTVSARVQFRVGATSTRPYEIKVSCAPVSFFSTAGQSGGAGRRVNCTAA